MMRTTTTTTTPSLLQVTEAHIIDEGAHLTSANVSPDPLSPESSTNNNYNDDEHDDTSSGQKLLSQISNKYINAQLSDTPTNDTNDEHNIYSSMNKSRQEITKIKQTISII